IKGTRARIIRSFCTTADGGAEADAEASLSAVLSVIDEALARVPSGVAAAHVSALAVACFWHSLVGVDAEGRALTPVYGWADTRAARQAAELREELDERATHARTGCRLHASYWPAKLRWIRRERGGAWRGVTRWLSFGELLTLRLCGATAASVSMASGTGLFDQRLCDWDAPLVKALGLDARTLPALAREGEQYTLREEFASRWPALRGSAIFPAVGDGAANNVGEGCTTRGRAALMVGTSGAMRVSFEGEPPAELHEGLWCYRVNRRRVCVGGALSDGGGLYEWMSATFAPGGADFAQEVATLAPDSHGLTLLPFWSGERSTGWHPFASGAILGLTAHTRPAEITRAALEAVAYCFASIAEALEAHAPGAFVCASGGALRSSPLWTQVLSDVLGRTLSLSRVAEASSRGAVLLALEALGAIKSVNEVASETDGACTPDAARQEIYRRGLERQRKIYDLLINNQEVARIIGEASATSSRTILK
ncbi:MAG: gluconokinase, partial [Acidobacteria bacterium]|nr:gluconokinase [Acidobacteriota bacterium]